MKLSGIRVEILFFLNFCVNLKELISLLVL
jgi:hypothetical protein